jgi:hypothetical protein
VELVLCSTLNDAESDPMFNAWAMRVWPVQPEKSKWVAIGSGNQSNLSSAMKCASIGTLPE